MLPPCTAILQTNLHVHVDDFYYWYIPCLSQHLFHLMETTPPVSLLSEIKHAMMNRFTVQISCSTNEIPKFFSFRLQSADKLHQIASINVLKLPILIQEKEAGNGSLNPTASSHLCKRIPSLCLVFENNTEIKKCNCFLIIPRTN